jgi:hypothetical protein
VLQKIGRNLVNFQKLEAMLKHLRVAGQAEGFTSQLEEQVKRTASSVSRMTLGALVQEMATTLFDNHTTTQGRLELVPEAWLSMKFTLEGGQEAAESWKKEMMAIVKERNELVHQMLASFDPNSIQSCEVLAVALDAQRTRILPVYQHIQSLLLALKESQVEMLEHFHGRKTE